MKLSAPKKNIWWIALILGVLGILIRIGVVTIATLSQYDFWLVAIAFVLLALATYLKKM